MGVLLNAEEERDRQAMITTENDTDDVTDLETIAGEEDPGEAKAAGAAESETKDEPKEAAETEKEEPSPEVKAEEGTAEKGAAEEEDVEPEAAPVAASSHLDELTTSRLYVTPPVEGYKEKVAEIETKLADLEKRYEDGDPTLDATSYKSETRDLNKQLTRLETLQTRHETDLEAANNASAQGWDRAYQSWSKSIKASGGPDYQEDQARFQGLLDYINVVANAADRAGEEITRRQLLDRAHERLCRDLGEPVKPAKAAKAAKPAKAAEKRKDPARPITLAHMPASDTPAATGVAGEEFAHLDAMSDIDRTAALARMSAADRQRYLEA